MYDVGTVQPVSVKVYDYYKPGMPISWLIGKRLMRFSVSIIYLVLLCISSQLIPARNFTHRIQKVHYLQAFVKKAIAGAHKVFF